MRRNTPPIWDALGAQAEQQHGFLNVVGLVVSLVSLVVFVPLSLLFGEWRGNLVPLSLAFAASAWFAFVQFTPPRRWIKLLDETVALAFVSCIPAALVYWLSVRHGPTLGFGSWIASQIGIVIIAASGLSFRVRQPLLCSVLIAASYVAMYFALRGSLPAEDARELWSARVTVFRVVALVVWGAIWSGLIYGVRRSIGDAFSTARQQDLFGKYRLGDPIASGGMGSVARATYCPEGGFEREVAVKRIHPHLVTDPAVVDRFRQEAELGARLLHPNIVATLDFGRVDDTYFVAMEYVDGASLRTVLRKSLARGRPVPERVVAGIGRELCRALEFAHTLATDTGGRRLRVIHDDICPDNVLLTRGGVPKLADFGVARALRDASHHVTEHIVGKVGYLAPEQILGDPFDARVDLFSLGCVLWETLTGRRLFRRKDVGSSLHAIVSGEVPALRKLRPGLSVGWDAFFARSLAVDPERRFASAVEMGEALSRLLVTPLRDGEVADWVRPLFEEDVEATAPTTPAPVDPTVTTPAAALPPRTVVDEEPAWTVLREEPLRAA